MSSHISIVTKKCHFLFPIQQIIDSYPISNIFNLVNGIKLIWLYTAKNNAFKNELCYVIVVARHILYTRIYSLTKESLSKIVYVCVYAKLFIICNYCADYMAPLK